MRLVFISRFFLILITLLFFYCKRQGEVHYTWGCEPPCKEKHWLTFDYDSVLLFNDSSGTIKKTLDDEDLQNYIRLNKGKRLAREDVEFLDQALSCGTWICQKTLTKKVFYDPEYLIVFLHSDKVVAYVSMCSKSGVVECKPDSENKEIDLFAVIVRQALNRH